MKRHPLKPFRLFVCLAIATLVSMMWAGCRSENRDPNQNRQPEALRVFAASSLTDVLGEISREFQDQTSREVRLNLASSGTLARQIAQGARADLFISAHPAWSEYLDSLGLIRPPGLTYFAGNSLVLVTPSDSNLQPERAGDSIPWEAWLSDGMLSMGDPAHVPAGKYAAQALETMGFRGKTLPAMDVRAALMVVEMGEAPLGVVYASDARRSEKVRVLLELPDSLYSQIRYTGGIYSDREGARALLRFLTSAEAGKIWRKHGFKTVP